MILNLSFKSKTKYLLKMGWSIMLKISKIKRAISLFMTAFIVLGTMQLGGITAYAATQTNTNILVNGSANDGLSGWTFPEGWRALEGALYIGSSPCDEKDGTDKYFDYYNPGYPTTSVYQDVSISGLESKINAGYITAEFSIFYFGQDTNEKLTLKMIFYNASSDKPVTHSVEMGYVSGYEQKKIDYIVPADTTKIRVQIEAESPIYCCIAFDGANLTLKDNTVDPVVTTQEATTITSTTATANASITVLGNPVATDYGICYGTSENPTIDSSKISKGTPTAAGAFTADMINLAPNTKYYVRAYATNGAGTIYGSQLNFTTLALDPPEFSPDTSGNNADNEIEIRYTPNAAYQAAITSVSFNGTVLTPSTDYDVSSDKIILKPNGGNIVLKTASTNSSVIIKATNYKDATVTQTIEAGAAASIEITTQPAGPASNAKFATQPVVKLMDKNGNVCATGSHAAAIVTAAPETGTSGTWTIGGTSIIQAVNGVATFSDLTCTTTKLGSGAITFFCNSGAILKCSDSFTLPKFGGLANTAATTINVPNKLKSEHEYSVTITDDLMKLNKTGTDTGTVSYSLSEITNTNNIIKNGTVKLTGALLEFTLNPDISAATPSTIPIHVETQYYEGITVDLQVVNNINMITPSISGSVSAGGITYGDKLSAASITGTFIDAGTSSAVSGTLSWDTPDTMPSAGSYTADWTFKPTNTLKYYSIKGTANVAVAKRPITIELTNSSYSKTYGDTDPEFGYRLKEGTLVSGYTLIAPIKYTGKNAGIYDIVVDTQNNTNYAITLTNGTNAFTINKRQLSITSVLLEGKVYDGTGTINPSSITAAFNGTVSGDVIYYNRSATPYADVNVGANKSTTITITPTGDTDTNYYLNTNTIPTMGVIKRATTSASFSKTIDTIHNSSKTYVFDLDSVVLDGVTAPKTTGTRTYSILNSTGSMTFTQPPQISPDGKTLSFTTDSSNAAGNTHTIKITISSQNYDDVTATLTVNTVNKTELAVSGVSITNKTYDGSAVTPMGTPVFKDGSDHVVPIDTPVYSYASTDGAGYSSEQAPKNAGAYKLTISVPQSNIGYIGSTDIPFTIAKALLTITAQNKTITVGDAIPAYTFSYSGFKNGETENTAGMFITQPIASCAGNSDTPTTYDITFNTPVSPNYTITPVNAKLFVQPKPANNTFYSTNKAANARGWYNSNIVITPTAVDGFDKVKIDTTGSFANSVTISTEAGHGTAILYFAKANAVTESTNFVYKFDKTAPVLANITYNPSVSFTRGLLNFFTGSVSVSVNVSDNLSGVDKVSYELIPDANGGTAKTDTVSVNGSGVATVSINSNFAGKIRFSASDLADNTSTLLSDFVTEDTAPAIEFSIAEPNSAGWYKKDVTLTTIVKDNAQSAISGGIRTINWTDNNGSSDYTPTDLIYEYTKQTVVNTEGGYTNTVTATDNSGNTSTKPITIQLDKTAPNINAVQSAPIAVGRPYEGYRLTISATDAGGSNIAGYSIDGGATWQTNNLFEVLESKTISAGNIKVKDTADNITTSVASDIVITVPKISSYTALTADKTNIPYGGSLTLTAEVTTDPSITKAIAGTVNFYLGTDATGTKIAEKAAIVNGKATCEVTKAIYSDSGSKNFFASYSGNANFEPSSNAINNIAVAPLSLTVKATDIACYSGGVLPTPKIEYRGFIDGENAANALTDNTFGSAHTAVNTNTAGKYQITLSGDAKAKNYTINKQNGTLTVKVKSTNAIETNPTDTPAANAPSVVIPKNSLPEGASLSNIRLIINEPTQEEKQRMAQVIEEKMKEIPKSQILQYDISIIDIANGNVVVQPGDYIKIVLPYPSGSNKSHTFRIVHLIDGTTPEMIACTNMDNGIEFWVKSLSPFMIGYVSNASHSSSNNDNDDQSTEQDFWNTVEKEIKNAKSGDVIKANVSKYIETMPVRILKTIKGKNVVLTISWQNNRIVINGNNVIKIERNRVFYKLKALAELYEQTITEAVTENITANVADKQTKPKYINPSTGGEVDIESPTVIISSLRDIPNIADKTVDTPINSNITEDGLIKSNSVAANTTILIAILAAFTSLFGIAIAIRRRKSKEQ
ncbi:MBG domain-containing protein [Oscillospiraceae bacterium PP1C4]